MPKPCAFPRLATLGLGALALLSACATNSAIQESLHLSALGRHERAFRVLDAARQAELDAGDQPSEELERLHAEALKRHLLERARWRIFAEREPEALADLAALERIAPDYPELQTLRERAIHKQADRAVQVGNENLLRKDLQGALANYLRAESLLPGYPPAIEGSERVRAALGELSAKAQRQFLEAVRKLPEFRFIEVRWHAEIALFNAPQREDAERIRERARNELATKAIERARECLRGEKYGAALLEFRNAQKLDPERPGLAEEILAVEREIEAALLTDKAQSAMRTEQFDLAREHLGRAFELSELSRGEISELMMEVRKREGQAKYQAARDLEILGKKAEALAAFEALAAEWPEGLSDEQARIDGLRLDVETAQKEWEAAEAAEAADDLPAALQHYEAAMQFHPALRDVADRIARLKQRIAEQSGGEPTGEPQ